MPVPFNIPSPIKYVSDIRSLYSAHPFISTPWVAGMKVESPRTPYMAERKGRYFGARKTDRIVKIPQLMAANVAYKCQASNETRREVQIHIPLFNRRTVTFGRSRIQSNHLESLSPISQSRYQGDPTGCLIYDFLCCDLRTYGSFHVTRVSEILLLETR